MESFLSPDGLRLYFVSNSPLHDSISGTNDYDIWYVDWLSNSSAWSQPINMGAPINSEQNEFYPGRNKTDTTSTIVTGLQAIYMSISPKYTKTVKAYTMFYPS